MAESRGVAIAMANQRHGGGHGSPSKRAEASGPLDFNDPAPANRFSPYGTKSSVLIKKQCDKPGIARQAT